MLNFLRNYGFILLFLFSAYDGMAADNDMPTPRRPGPGKINAPQIEIETPSTQNFFRKGRQIFPKNFQVPEGEVKPTAGLPTTGVDEDYPVGPGDQFLINFWGRIEDNIIVQVNTDGKLFIPRVGVLEVKDLTYGAVQKKIGERLNAALKNVSFTISLYQLRNFEVYVLGAVNNPGPFRANANSRVSQIVELAGGINSTGSNQFIELRRRGEVLQVNLLKYLNEVDFAANPFVTNGDVIFVPNLSDFVTLTGAIVQPGTFEIEEVNKLDEIVRLMGGLSVYADRTAPIRVSRLMPSGGREQIRVWQTADLAKKNNDFFLGEVAVQHGDEIFIPSSNLLIPSKTNSVFVTGEVKVPGVKMYQLSMSIDEYIGASGGLTSRADFEKAVVYKSDGSTVPVEPRMPVEPGDTIYIPEKTFKFWQDHLTIITAFISLATSVIVFTGR